MTARCPKHRCGEPLRFSIDRLGRVVATCEGCERNRRGLCRDCPRKITSPWSFRCPACAKRRRLQLHQLVNGRYRRSPNGRRVVNGQHRRYYHTHRAAERLRSRNYRQRHREERIAASRQYYRDNRERLLADQRIRDQRRRRRSRRAQERAA